MVSVAANLRARAMHQHGEHQPDGSLAHDHHEVLGLRIALHHGFQAGVQRLDQGGALEGDAVGNLLHAALHNPVHHPHILREAAARRLETRP